ncbi:MAG: type IV secretion system protein VirB8 [Opitutaceae bacterium]|nr:type IV secretion system protein VirB8 [Opitutaceae bacterium]
MNAEMKNAALPIDDERLASYFQNVESFQAAEKRTARRWGRVGWGVAGVSLAVNLALGVAIVMILPLEKLVPAFITVNSDGTTNTSMSFSSLPANEQDAVIRASIWQYVQDRESYDFPNAQYRYDVTSLMSAPTVQGDYQSWFLDKGPTSTSPQVLIGKKGQISVDMISMSMVRSNVAIVQYRRTVQMYGSAPETETWTATVGFENVDTLPVSARLSDPSGLIVTNYQALKDTP